MKKLSYPPGIFHWILKRFLPPYSKIPLLGDLEEEFQFICHETGLKNARRWYRWQFIKSVPSLLFHFAYWSVYVGLYFLLFYFFSDLALIILLKSYLKRNANEFTNLTDSLEDLYQKYGISKREKQIITEICRGKTNQEIADELFISLQTVKDHTYNIFRKVNVRNRVQLTQVFSHLTL